MNRRIKSVARSAVLLTAAVAATSAHAVIVIDPLNAAINFHSKLVLLQVLNQLQSNSQGTVNYYTNNIDKSTTNLHTITKQYNELNYDIDASFTWIINGGEIIPIPGPVKDKLKAILGERSVEQYTANYKAAGDFGTDLPGDGLETAVEGSRSRKAANDALVQAVNEDQIALESELTALNTLRDKAEKAPQGQGHQLQVANALSASQVNQMMKLRSMLVVSEAARAAEAQVAADRDARAIAIGTHLRAGLDEAVSHSLAPRPVC